MTVTVAPICYCCRHLHRDRLREGEGFFCDAFPSVSRDGGEACNGIPLEILKSRPDHRAPFPGDSGVTFEEDPQNPLGGRDPFKPRDEGRGGPVFIPPDGAA
jgi:hypothetical protein